MSNAGRGTALPRDNELSRIDAIARAYVDEAGGDAGAALRLAVTDALAHLAEMERRIRQVERFVSRGFVRGRFTR
jgi:hypothetical protein